MLMVQSFCFLVVKTLLSAFKHTIVLVDFSYLLYFLEIVRLRPLKDNKRGKFIALLSCFRAMLFKACTEHLRIGQISTYIYVAAESTQTW
jgi:hypothetical protein